MSSSTSTEPAFTRDALLAGKVALWQPTRGYRVAVDPVLLAAAVEPKAGDRVLDMGCGVAAISLCLLARCPDISVVGLERNVDLVDLARRNAAENGFAPRLEILQGSVAEPPAAIAPGSFDRVLMNPPYLEAGAATASPDHMRHSANMEGEEGLKAWIDAAARALKPKGSIAMIHRSDQIDRVIATLIGGFGEIVIHPLWPKAGHPAKRLIVRARKDVRTPARIDAGTVLHQADGTYTEAARRLLEGASLASSLTL